MLEYGGPDRTAFCAGFHGSAWQAFSEVPEKREMEKENYLRMRSKAEIDSPVERPRGFRGREDNGMSFDRGGGRICLHAARPDHRRTSTHPIAAAVTPRS